MEYILSDYQNTKTGEVIKNAIKRWKTLDDAVADVGKETVLTLANQKWVINQQNILRNRGKESKTAKAKRLIELVKGNEKLLKQFPQIAELLK